MPAATEGARSIASRIAATTFATPLDRFIVLVFCAALIGAVIVLCITVAQPILESYGFRQAQTALTAYWFGREGYALAYQTPVLGYPWQVPFELPLFQAIVAALASLVSYPLENIGRAVSFAFFVATLGPIAVICRKLGLGHRVFYVFASLYLLSPQYLFWGRTFMIESTATFFCVAMIAAALPLFVPRAISFWRALGVVMLGSLAMTLKVTTGLPVVAVLIAVLGALALVSWRNGGKAHVKTLVLRGLLLALPVIVGLAWTHFTDVVKMQNEIGKLLTTSALPDWSLGTLDQRFSRIFASEVVWRRSLSANAAGVLGLAVMSFFMIEETRRARLWMSLCLVALFILPLLVFTNLHIFHTYYQSANVIYLLLLLAIALVFLAEHTSGRLFVVTFALVLASHIGHFHREYWRLAHQRITADNNLVMAAAKIVREESPPDKPILVYGLDWSSELPYYAQRKALAVPDWYPKFEEPLADPGRYFGGARVGGLVVCASIKQPAEQAVQRFLTSHGPFREVSIWACRIFVSS
jgi:hypothetical protein